MHALELVSWPDGHDLVGARDLLHDPVPFSWLDWGSEPGVLFGVLLVGAAYLYGAGLLRRRPGVTPMVTSGQAASFLLGLLLVVVALDSPLHLLAERYLLTAHMVQHLLLTMAIAPSLLLGLPAPLLRRAVRSPIVFAIGRRLTSPLIAFFLFNGVFSLSHLPVFYEAALQQEALHAAEHLAYLATALLMWWPVLSPLPELPRISYPLQLLYLFLQVVPSSAVGALITLSPEPLYPTYAAAPRLFDLSPMGDQQLGGAIMWVGDALIFLLAFTVIFFIWVSKEADRADWTDAATEEPAPELPQVR